MNMKEELLAFRAKYRVPLAEIARGARLSYPTVSKAQTGRSVSELTAKILRDYMESFGNAED